MPARAGSADAVLELAERLDAAPTIAAAWAEAVPALAGLGIEWCYHGYAASPCAPTERPSPLLHLTNLPDWWSRHHAAEGYWRADASTRHCARSVASIATGAEFAEAAGDAAWARMCADGHAAGFGCGLALPLRCAPGAAFGGFALITRSRGAKFRAWRAAHGQAVLLAAHAVANRLLALAEVEEAPRRPRLSPRELECLLWLAVGLRSDRIAERLGLSRATVDLHLARARRRLSAATREQAVAKALSLGLLHP